MSADIPRTDDSLQVEYLSSLNRDSVNLISQVQDLIHPTQHTYLRLRVPFALVGDFALIEMISPLKT